MRKFDIVPHFLHSSFWYFGELQDLVLVKGLAHKSRFAQTHTKGRKMKEDTDVGNEWVESLDQERLVT